MSFIHFNPGPIKKPKAWIHCGQQALLWLSELTFMFKAYPASSKEVSLEHSIHWKISMQHYKIGFELTMIFGQK